MDDDRNDASWCAPCRLFSLPLLALYLVILTGCENEATESADGPATSVAGLRRLIQVPGEPTSVLWEAVTLGSEEGRGPPGPRDWALVADIRYQDHQALRDAVGTLDETTLSQIPLPGIVIREWLPTWASGALTPLAGGQAVTPASPYYVPEPFARSPLLDGLAILNEADASVVVVLVTK